VVGYSSSGIPPGRPRVLSRLYEEELLAYLDERPIAYLDKIAYYLLKEFNIAV